MTTGPKICLYGASGRMGRELTKLLAISDSFELYAGLVRANSPHLGKDLGQIAGIHPLGILASSNTNLIEVCDVVIDFSSPGGAEQCASVCARYAKPLVSCTTGFSEKDPAYKAIEQAASRAPVVQAFNTSIGVAVLAHLVSEAAQYLKNWDVGILDVHHKYKKDAPSGTANFLEKIILKETETCVLSSLRVGNVVGEHKIVFEHEAEEEVTITHKALNRTLFAKGALKAAHWLLLHKQSGLFSMQDVLEIT